MWGATPSSPSMQRRHRYFNPRAPCGARPELHAGLVGFHDISIHAPRVGRDIPPPSSRGTILTFQSTRPVWGATRLRRQHGARRSYFNPRAPCGARPPQIDQSYLASSISIHAPRVGRDGLVGRLDDVHAISIHAPRVGRDQPPRIRGSRPRISIHAPRVGRDVWCLRG